MPPTCVAVTWPVSSTAYVRSAATWRSSSPSHDGTTNSRSPSKRSTSAAVELIYTTNVEILDGVFAQDRLWLADEGGVFELDPLDPSAPTAHEPLSAEPVALATSPDGTEVWAAAQDGSV